MNVKRFGVLLPCRRTLMLISSRTADRYVLFGNKKSLTNLSFRWHGLLCVLWTSNGEEVVCCNRLQSQATAAAVTVNHIVSMSDAAVAALEPCSSRRYISIGLTNWISRWTSWSTPN